MKKLILSIAMLLLVLVQSKAQTDSAQYGAVSDKRLINTTIASGALIGLGLWSFKGPGIWNKFEFQKKVQAQYPNFHTHVDDYIQFVPGVAVYALDWCGVKAKNDFWNRTLLLAKAELLNSLITTGLKNYTKIMRPDNSADNSFPSGHTSQAFVVATFMHFEYGEKSIWYSIGAYSVATATGALRIMNNKHWLTDVVTGAGIGMLSTTIVYKTHLYRWGKRPGTDLTLMPLLGEKQNGVYLSYTF